GWNSYPVSRISWTAQWRRAARSNAMTTDITVERLARAIEAATLDIDEHGRQIAVSLWNLLADGSAATSADIAAHSGVDDSIVDERLSTCPGLFRDEEWPIVGS